MRDFTGKGMLWAHVAIMVFNFSPTSHSQRVNLAGEYYLHTRLLNKQNVCYKYTDLLAN